MEGTTGPQNRRRISWQARIDLALGAILLGGFFWSLHVSAREQQEGFQITPLGDPGAYLELGGMLVLLPLGLLFLMAGIGLRDGWRIARFLHWVAVIAAVLLVMIGYQWVVFYLMLMMDSLRHR